MVKSIASALVLFSAMLLVAPQTARGDGASSIRHEIRRLAGSIRAEVGSAQVSRDQLEKARWHLEQALLILEGRSGGAASAYDFDACTALAYAGYAKSHSSSFARTRAVEQCKKPLAVGVARVLYETYAKSHSSGMAMDRALEKARQSRLFGKQALVAEAIRGYARSHSSGFAADRAVEKAASLRADGLRCLSQAFQAHSKSHSASMAMDQAFAECQQRFADK